MKTNPNWRFETLAVHAGHGVDPATGAVAQPIHLSTTFERDADGGYARGYVYARNAPHRCHAGDRRRPAR
jgi:cystathionine gamma-synthase